MSPNRGENEKYVKPPPRWYIDGLDIFGNPIKSMYGIFTYIFHKNQPKVAKYTSPMDPLDMFGCGFCLGKKNDPSLHHRSGVGYAERVADVPPPPWEG